MGLVKALGVLAVFVGCTPPTRVVAPGSPPIPPALPPVVVMPVAEASEPVLAISPYLVESLPPLGDKQGQTDVHDPSVAMTAQVMKVERGHDRARVRVRRTDGRMDRNWTAVFVNAAGQHLGDCKIVAWDANELECVTTLPLAKMSTELELEPPPRERQIKQVLLAQAQGDELLVTFAAGTNDDLGDDWKAALVDENGVVVPKGDCRIVSVSTATTMCRTRAKVVQLSGMLATRP